MLTWSLGWTGFFEPMIPPSISIARFEITSFAFMLDCVPEPVCQTTSGKCSFSLSSVTSCAPGGEAEVLVQLAVADFLGGCDDHVAEFLVDLAERHIGLGGCAFDDS